MLLRCTWVDTPQLYVVSLCAAVLRKPAWREVISCIPEPMGISTHRCLFTDLHSGLGQDQLLFVVIYSSLYKLL